MKNDIEALRGFSSAVIYTAKKGIKQGFVVGWVLRLAINYGLMNEKREETELLTGSKDLIEDAQRRLYWAWLTDMSKTKVEAMGGRIKEDWHWEMKLKYLVPIFIRDDSEFAEMYCLYDLLYSDDERTIGDREIIKEKFLGKLSITDATKEQATEYLRDIENFCRTNGIMLRTDMAIYKTAMERK